MNEKTDNTASVTKLFNPNKPPAQVIKIKCTKCGYVGEPNKWNAKWIFGIAYLFTSLNLIGLLIYFVFTNPYICKQCGERNKLVKILNDGGEKNIRSLSKSVFLTISITFLILGLAYRFIA